MTTLGERLRRARKRKGLSQVDVQNAIGLSNKSLSRYENGDADPAPDTLQRLIRLYDVSSEYILGITDSMGRSTDSSETGTAETLIGMIDHRSSAERLLGFIGTSPTMFHAAENISRRLLNDGFEQLNEWDQWDLKRGGKYFTVRNSSSVIAFKVGEGEPAGFNIYCAHSDSPTFKLKPNFELETLGHYIRLDTERYGGGIMPSWFDRPLSIAGRIAVSSTTGVRTVLVNLDEDCAIIPNVASHMQRNINDGFTYNAQVDTIPLIGSLAAKGALMSKVAETAGVKESQIAGADLYLYNRMPGIIWGADGEYVSSPKLDDLQCAFAGLQGILSGENKDTVSVLAVFDNEEVGSSTKQGANSDFLTVVTDRIAKALGIEKAAMTPKSFVVSADNAHAVHPNHPEYADPINRPYMNEGIVIKHAARQSYATDAVSEAIFRKICGSVAVPVQCFANRSDLSGGSTLGNISATRFSVATVDIGLAQLSMHSSYETAGTLDTLYLERAAAEFFRTKFERTPDGGYELKL